MDNLSMVSRQKPILVVGSINIDLVATAERIPVTGETVAGSAFATHPGGKGANQAVAVARLGYPVSMIGKVGDDVFGAQLREQLASAGVDTRAVTTVAGSSGVAVIVVSPRGENIIVVTPGANASLLPADLDAHRALIQSAGMVLTQLEIPLETVMHLAGMCHDARVPLMLDPAPALPLPPALLAHVTWFTPNETEASFYADALKPTSVTGATTAETCMSLGMEGVLLKRGERGVTILAKDGIEQQIPAFPVQALDTTAAGDAFNGAFATALMLGRSPVESARFAAAAAAISVTRRGAQPSMPSFAEVIALLQKHA